jgi:GntR family transcriptional repressor for pyruvate dehydrogenase complex
MKSDEFFIDRTRVSDQVKKILKQAMMDGKYKPGDKIPTEEKMAQQFKVSKATIREALRDLEAEGLIEKRRGLYGGSFIARPGSEKIGEWVINSFRVGTITPEELVDFRQILEPALVSLAVERRTDKDLRAIQLIIQEIEEGILRGKPNRPKAIEFHRLIAEACHNRLISMVMEALVNVFIEILSKIPMTIEDAKVDLDYCKKIYHYLVYSKRKKAHDLMINHFKTLTQIIEHPKRNHRKKQISMAKTLKDLRSVPFRNGE